MFRDILIPDPLSSDKQFVRFYHLDVPELEDSELADEYHYFRAHLFRLPADDWLRERVARLEAELIKRKVNIFHEFRGRPKPKLAEGVKP